MSEVVGGHLRMLSVSSLTFSLFVLLCIIVVQDDDPDLPPIPAYGIVLLSLPRRQHRHTVMFQTV